MFGWVKPLLRVGGTALELIGLRERRAARADAEKSGAAKQREADQAGTLEKKSEQLEDEARHRHTDVRDRLRKNDF